MQLPRDLEAAAMGFEEEGSPPREGKARSDEPGEAIAAPGVGTETVLIAEDEEAIRELARAALENHGYTVLLAGDGEEALALLERHGSTIDLVVSDLVMPRRGGAELRRAARRLVPDVRFLLTTGYAELEAQPVGAEPPREAPVLLKPWTGAKLRARVREVLDS
ncbi:MAG: response regulator [Thermoanaerobaculia bacterium]